MVRFFILTFLSLQILSGLSQEYSLKKQDDRWAIQPDGSIEWKIDSRLPHSDHIEMSGQKVSLWMQYGVDTSGKSTFVRTLVFPTHRLLPPRTIAHMTYHINDGDLPRFLINDRLVKAGVYNAAVVPDQPEQVISIRHRGIMEVKSILGRQKAISLQRSFFPSTDKPLAIEKFVFTNISNNAVKVEMEYLKRETRPALERTKEGPHHFIVSTIGHGEKMIQPRDSVIFAITYQATRGSGRPRPWGSGHGDVSLGRWRGPSQN